VDSPVSETYDVTIPQLVSFAEFYLSIDYHFPFLDADIGFTAGADQVQVFEQFIELDKFFAL
jgi:hypothetical protein